MHVWPYWHRQARIDKFYIRKVRFELWCNAVEQVLRDVLSAEHRFLVYYERFRFRQ
jgi:hypothetical protein